MQKRLVLNMNDQPESSREEEQRAPLLRSSTVAKMVPMPVATLRIWEQRYQAVRPGTLPSGHRRYSANDVARLRCLRQLVAQGHAIGALASLDNHQLHSLLQPAPATAGPAERPVMVVGAALAARLMRPALTQQLPQAIKLVAVWQALPELAVLDALAGADLLIWELAGLHRALPSSLLALRAARPGLQVVVVYRYAGEAALSAYAEAGITVLREPVDDGQLAGELAPLLSAPAAPGAALALQPGTVVPPRRYDDAALAAIIDMRASLLCECPRHLAGLLLQLNQFEAYSAACRHDSPADAELHAQLQRVAATSRSMFEAALESVISHAATAQR